MVTQNIDELHTRAGSTNVVELHGSLFRTLCTKCGEIATNRDSPICLALNGKGCVLVYFTILRYIYTVD